MSEIKQVCHECQGETTIPTSDSDPTPVSCVHCNNTGYEPILMGKVDDSDIIDKLNDMADKLNDLKEKVDEIKAVVDAL